METVEVAVVKLFKPTEGDHYGFLIDGENDLFFHINAEAEIVIVAGMVELAPKLGKARRNRPDPVEGDRLVFIRGESRDGRPRVIRWAYEKDWIAANNKLDRVWAAADRKLAQHHELTG